MRRTLLTLLIMIPLAMGAQTRTVGGDPYLYYSEPSQSFKQAREAAIQNARVQSLAKEFGTLLVQNTLQQDQLRNGQEDNYFIQLSSAEVKGEWIEDTREPRVVRKDITDEGVITFEVTVWGKAKPISNESVDFEALALRNGTRKRDADTNFSDHDDLFLYFKSPVDGYAAVYLIDDAGNANCLLPYARDNDGQQPVKHGKEYVFFSPEHSGDIPKDLVDECYMTCDDPIIEHNRIYVLFSPNPFTKADDEERHAKDRRLPRQLDQKKFTQWMSKLYAHDRKMGRKIIPITVRK